MKRVWKIVATCLGIGAFPLAPGTAASFAVILLYRFFLWRLPWLPYAALVLVVCILGVFAATALSSVLQHKDPRKVVVDEACGQLIVLFSVSPKWTLLLVAFFLFRFFDIAKPFPIRRVERLPAGWGIMADDVVAGLMAKIVLLLYLWLR